MRNAGEPVQRGTHPSPAKTLLQHLRKECAALHHLSGQSDLLEETFTSEIRSIMSPVLYLLPLGGSWPDGVRNRIRTNY
ncbi:hypothetical protein CEXT_521081 [Caerostris extrusa]|uniref:Uncharacterized protein n=1 Tax=Caerostris extrusa TaxID=172846 RepID=A0AAV4XEN6_CAEEX|nr:hypothetical protein CEXT_521081 [Caerostris extrusa]